MFGLLGLSSSQRMAAASALALGLVGVQAILGLSGCDTGGANIVPHATHTPTYTVFQVTASPSVKPIRQATATLTRTTFTPIPRSPTNTAESATRTPTVPVFQIVATATPSPKPQLFAEQEGNLGAPTFTDYHNASGAGPKVAAQQWVDVSCKVYDATITSVYPDGYWYRIASSPWYNAYYAAANTFLNGDPLNGPYSHNTDFNVPNC